MQFSCKDSKKNNNLSCFTKKTFNYFIEFTLDSPLPPSNKPHGGRNCEKTAAKIVRTERKTKFFRVFLRCSGFCNSAAKIAKSVTLWHKLLIVNSLTRVTLYPKVSLF